MEDYDDFDDAGLQAMAEGAWAVDRYGSRVSDRRCPRTPPLMSHLFSSLHCALCHQPRQTSRLTTTTTGTSSTRLDAVAAAVTAVERRPSTAERPDARVTQVRTGLWQPE